MAAKVEEAYSERTEKVNALGDIVEIEIHYLVFDAADEDAALAAARTKAKSKTVTGMTLAGFGFAAPLLRPYLSPARRVTALMPGPQGVMAWPAGGPP